MSNDRAWCCFCNNSRDLNCNEGFVCRRINENDLFKHDWRSRSKVQVLQYVFLKWNLAFLVGLLTGLIASLINLAIENVAGLKLLVVAELVGEES